MTVVVTPLSGSEKLRLRDIFASVQDSGPLSGYIRTYGFNGLLDRVEGNANVHRWPEQTLLGKGDSITVGYMSELSDYTCISVTQNNLQELKAIWDQWGNETKQSFYSKYGDLPYLFDIQVDENLFRALAQFWNPAYSCFAFGEVDLVPTVEEYTALLRCPRFQCDRIYSRAACVPTFGKNLMTITGMSEQWIMARIKEKGESKCIPWGALKDLIQTHPDEVKRVDIFALSLYGLMVFPKVLGYVDEATTDIFHRLSKRVTSVPAILAEMFTSLKACRRASAGRFVGCAKLLLAWFYSHFRLIDRVICRVFFEDYSPLKDMAASTRRVDVLEKNWIALFRTCSQRMWSGGLHGQFLVRFFTEAFIPTTYGLVQSEFVYRGADYKRKVSEISSAWNRTCQLKGVAISPATTPEKNLELEKRIVKLEEEKIYLSLDVDVQKREVEKERKEKRKIEEDRDDLKKHYKRAQVSLKRARIGGSSDQLQKEVREERSKAEYWERKFQEMQLQNLTLEKENQGLKTKVTELGRSLHL
ncbi:hypothetical protein CXB51_004336 [Gossypium anomalum]|uniref:DUF7745 domain-containing protein n=1 Tax=Gossypium anomalum TaxID=47600 RepID=A0A8J5ZZJ2_9ROSI|nr:hypothetical protein CXB51_004336 [Gossypium anomalum]